MGFLLRAVDRLIAAGLSVAGALSASQLQAFIQQYLQRLGGHLDEARLAVERLLSSATYQATDQATRDALAALARARVIELEAAMMALRDAPPVSLPLTFLRHFDSGVAAAAFRDFQPAIPLDVISLVYAAAAALAAPALYGLLKLPFIAIRSRRKTRPAA